MALSKVGSSVSYVYCQYPPGKVGSYEASCKMGN